MKCKHIKVNVLPASVVQHGDGVMVSGIDEGELFCATCNEELCIEDLCLYDRGSINVLIPEDVV